MLKQVNSVETSFFYKLRGFNLHKIHVHEKYIKTCKKKWRVYNLNIKFWFVSE